MVTARWGSPPQEAWAAPAEATEDAASHRARQQPQLSQDLRRERAAPRRNLFQKSWKSANHAKT